MTRRSLVVGLVVAAVGLQACGGGGGGGGGGGSGKASAAVSFTGFSFRSEVFGDTTVPPFENPSGVPPTLGAPLNLVVIFHFSGVPDGPFNGTTLPVFTTGAEVTPEAFAPAGAIIPAKGDYVLVGTSVEFRPFVPTEPLAVKLSSPDGAIPGLLPASVYTAQVSSTAGAKIKNLSGPGGAIKFGTTSNEAMFYAGSALGFAPTVVSSVPTDGTEGFYPGPFDNTPYDRPFPTYPPGPADFVLTYDRAVLPLAENISGKDIDADGRLDPMFFLRTRATRLLVGHEVPAGSSIGNAGAFPALSGLTDGASPASTGADIFLHNSQGGGALPGGNAAVIGVPTSVAPAADPSLVFVLFKETGAPDKLAVIDHALGDPSYAALSSAVSTGLDDLYGMTTLLDGRLVVYDRTTRRIYELLPTVSRSRLAGTPGITGLEIGTGMPGEGFRSTILSTMLEITDLAQSPAGLLYALADLPPAAPTPTLVRLQHIDFDLNDDFETTDGQYLGNAGDIVLPLGAVYADIAFESEEGILALNRTTDSIDRIDLSTGSVSTVVMGIAAYGKPLGSFPGGLSPARAFGVGFLEQDVGVSLLGNSASGAVVHAVSLGLLPVGAELWLMQRNTFSSLNGVSLANADLLAPGYLLGAVRLLDVETSLPEFGTGIPDPDTTIDDVMFEGFLTKALEDPAPQSLSPKAEWAELVAGATTSGSLRASTGASETAALGDFRPVPGADFSPTLAFKNPVGGAPPNAHFAFVFLDTDVQNFPLPNGATPGVTTPVTVQGGAFTFRDFIIPEGVRVIVRGSRPLQITATGKVEIHGLLDVSGGDGAQDSSFHTGFLPVPGGSAGPGGGRGGDAHPTLFDPNGPVIPMEFVTPETGEQGYGPEVQPSGSVLIKQIGGRGGLSMAGYAPKNAADPLALDFLFPDIPGDNTDPDNNERHRPPGGAGGTFFYHGTRSHEGAGDYLVQSNSTFFPFTKCLFNNGIDDLLYGNEENVCRVLSGLSPLGPVTPLQCVYRTYVPLQPGAEPGDLVFGDANAGNDFIGLGGELPVLIGGQGGGGGGSRVGSIETNFWAEDHIATPAAGLPCYPALVAGGIFSPTRFDAKGGGGGGGAGAVQIRCFGDILIGKTGHIDASGGDGRGGQEVGNSTFAGGGGGGSGGAILLQSAGEITIQADPDHDTPWYDDQADERGYVAKGAGLDVSGGFGFDARTKSDEILELGAPSYDATRGDGGQGGFGVIQLQEGTIDATPQIQQGAFLMARIRAMLKLGPWTGDANGQKEHAQIPGTGANKLPDEMRYIDMLHYRYFQYDPTPDPANDVVNERFFVLNGSDPPIIQPDPVVSASSFQLDTAMMDYFGTRVVKEPQPHKVMKTYGGFSATFVETNNGPSGEPGLLYATSDSIPFSVSLNEPDGTPVMVMDGGVERIDPHEIVDRLPVIPLAKTPKPFGAVSRGVSLWLDYSGVALRTRNVAGRSPPFFDGGVNGTFNPKVGAYLPELESLVMTGAAAQGAPAHFVKNTPSPPEFDPGLPGITPTQPFNDIKVDAPELSLENALSDNAEVGLVFQGAFPIRAGSHVPDPGTLSSWTSDLRELSGYPLIRFQVTFNLGKDLDAFPFGVESLRPAVDSIRLRTTY